VIAISCERQLNSTRAAASCSWSLGCVQNPVQYKPRRSGVHYFICFKLALACRIRALRLFPSSISARDLKPCNTAFCEAVALPSSVLGPVDFSQGRHR
jgi:hypothetical protein